MISLLCSEQEKEEGGEFYPLQRLSSDMATEGKPGYEDKNLGFNLNTCISVSVSAPFYFLVFSGGNSRTAMVAALSPADINYDETLSTLR